MDNALCRSPQVFSFDFASLSADHYEFRVAQSDAKTARKKLQLQKPPRKAGEKAWFEEDYKNPRKIKDRELFS